MYEIIRLGNKDLTKELFANVMFFSLAEGGAMGDPGAVYFYDADGNLYYFNYARDCIDMNKVREMFPILEKCTFGIFGIGSSAPEGWKYVNLGMGNHLIVNDTVFEEFYGYIKEETRPSKVYRMWMEIAEKILVKD